MKKKLIIVIMSVFLFLLVGCKSEKMETDRMQKGFIDVVNLDKTFRAVEFTGGNGTGNILGTYDANISYQLYEDSMEIIFRIINFEGEGRDFVNNFYITETPLARQRVTDFTLYFYFRYEDSYLGTGWIEARTDNQYNINQISLMMYSPTYGGRINYFLILDDDFKNNNIKRLN